MQESSNYFLAHNFIVRKFLDGRILEVPLIVLQYYKPSLFYIYKKKDHDLIYHYYKIKFIYKFIYKLKL
jgi:hypothetical protein